MKKLPSLVGQQYNQLTVLKEDPLHTRPKKWICQCSCGTIKSINQGSLRNGSIKSCGCFNKTKCVTHQASKSRLYNIWSHIKQRCNNPKNPAYKNYGGRGISICPEWENNFNSFQEWALNNGYQENLSIDRIDNNKGYNPTNCQWATSLMQSRNINSHSNSTSIYKGVCFVQKDNSYQVTIYVEGIHHYLGRFKEEKEAALAYNNFIINNNLKYYSLNKV